MSSIFIREDNPIIRRTMHIVGDTYDTIAIKGNPGPVDELVDQTSLIWE
jgi:hypothetical protein